MYIEGYIFFQEKYLSEAYSEAHDSDAARRLLEFGEDYRNFLDSQSDWSQSTNPECSPSFRRKILASHNVDLPSEDDDAENIRQLLQDSRDQLCYTKGIYKRQFNMGIQEYLVANDIVINIHVLHSVGVLTIFFVLERDACHL